MQIYLWQISPWLIIIVLVIIIVLTIFIINRVILAHRRQAAAGKEDLVGRIAVVDTALNPKGIVLVEGERWTAISGSGHIAPDEEVVITQVNGLKLQVVKK